MENASLAVRQIWRWERCEWGKARVGLVDFGSRPVITRRQAMNPGASGDEHGLGIDLASVAERRRKILRRPQLTVFVRQDRLVRPDRPGNVQAWVLPDDAAFGCGRIIAVDLVGHLGVGLERAEAVREATRDENLLTPLRADFFGDPLPLGRRFEA